MSYAASCQGTAGRAGAGEGVIPKRLTRDTKNAVLGGVAAGFANYFDLDPVLLRVVFILLTVLSGFGVVAYVVAWVIMPRQSEGAGVEGTVGSAAGAGGTPGDRFVESVREAGERVAGEFQRLPEGAGRGRVVAGWILIVLGVLFLLDRLTFWHWPHWARLANLWPAILIAIGVSIILQAARRRTGRTS